MSIFSKKRPQWIHITQPTHEQIQDIIKDYDVHSIVEEDLLSWAIQDKIDSYDDDLFMVVHFPKYDSTQDKYYANPVSIIIADHTIITIATYPISKLQEFYDIYTQDITKKNNLSMKSPYYVLYKILDLLYDKTLISLAKFSKDIQILEQDLFTRKKLNTKILSNLLVKRRNIIYLNHMLSPQSEILVELHTAVLKVFKEDGDVYFEDLQYKFDKIMHTIQTVSENARSLSTTYNALANIQTNSVISLLTVFTASIGILAMITGLYWMNVELPGQDNSYMFFVIVMIMIAILFGGLYLGKKKEWR